METTAYGTLRLARLSITRYRTFRERSDLQFSAHPAAVVDRVAVLHGDNGSGKSNAIAALDLFFRAARLWLIGNQRRPQEKFGEPVGVLELAYSEEYTGEDRIPISERDWPPGTRDPMELEVVFDDPTLGVLCVRFTQAGKRVLLGLERRAVDTAAEIKLTREEIPALLNRIEAPLGAASRPLFWIDARRREHSWPVDTIQQGAPGSPLSPSILERLLQLQNSMLPGERERWRGFTELLARFPTLRGQEAALAVISGGTELRIEWRGRRILRHTELSSGEQQIAALLAAMLTSGAPIVAIEEPEISLSEKNQRLLREVLQEQSALGLVDQVILESHVQVFDGPEVLQFTRADDGSTRATRRPAVDMQHHAELARRAGARAEWVTPDGYTQLPEAMLSALDLKHGGYLWFLRTEGGERWQAWREQELNESFGFAADDSDKTVD